MLARRKTHPTQAADQQGKDPGTISGATLAQPGPMTGEASMRFGGGGDVNLGTGSSRRPPANWTVEASFKMSAADIANCINTYHGQNCEFYPAHAL